MLPLLNRRRKIEDRRPRTEDRGPRTEDGRLPTTNHPPLPSAIRFAHLTPDDGLSQSVVESMAQDSLGFMWFGTQDGLNRYDGYGFKVFHAEPGNPRMPSANIILAMTTDATGKLWLGTTAAG